MFRLYRESGQARSHLRKTGRLVTTGFLVLLVVLWSPFRFLGWCWDRLQDVLGYAWLGLTLPFAVLGWMDSDHLENIHPLDPYTLRRFYEKHHPVYPYLDRLFPPAPRRPGAGSLSEPGAEPGRLSVTTHR